MNSDQVSHLHDEAPGDGDGVVVTQIQSLKQLTVNNNNAKFILKMFKTTVKLKRNIQ